MLRVVFVDQTGAEGGGAQESFALLLRNLPSWIAPHVIVFHDGTYARRLRDMGVPVEVFPVDESIVRSKREQPRIGGVVRLPGSVMRLASRFRRLQADVIYTHTVKAHFIGAPAARIAGLPCVMHLRDILEGKARLALRSVATLCPGPRIAISRSVAAAYGFRGTHVVLNPVDASLFAGGPTRAQASASLGMQLPDGVPVIGLIGRINRWKGHDRFIRIARLVRDRIDARFLIVGSAIFRDEDFVAELERMRDKLGLREALYFVPWLEDVRAAYALIDLNAIVSTREPFGRTTIEAAARSVPTVCFSDAGASEILTPGVDGLVVPAADEAAFSDAIVDLFSSGHFDAVSSRARALTSQCAPAAHASAVAGILKGAAA
jgi:glycosyltransferase involved in cell wall biosynthesis